MYKCPKVNILQQESTPVECIPTVSVATTSYQYGVGIWYTYPLGIPTP